MEEQGQGERRKEGGQALGKRIKAAAAASSHEQNRGRRETGGLGSLKGFFLLRSSMPFKKRLFYAPLKTCFLSLDEEKRAERTQRRKEDPLGRLPRTACERAVVSKDKQLLR